MEAEYAEALAELWGTYAIDKIAQSNVRAAEFAAERAGTYGIIALEARGQWTRPGE